MSWREGVLLSLVIHLVFVIIAITAPEWMLRLNLQPTRPQPVAAPQNEEPTRFVFVQPKLDLRAERPPERAEPSDLDRRRATPVPQPREAPLPYSRGDTTERVERSQQEIARGRGPAPDPLAGQTPTPPQPDAPPLQAESQLRLPEAQSALQIPSSRPPAERSPSQLGRAATPGGSLGDALRNLQRYVQRDQFENAQGGGSFGPAIQFDTKGVEFGPWIRRFIAQVKRNWLIPYAAMSMKGHVVVTFNVHKDGSITDLQVVGASPVDAFNNAAYGALASSNPTAPLPPEYPSDQAFFTVTFFYNEEPQ
jgi:TonB family protein